jgi:hypothetical protein
MTTTGLEYEDVNWHSTVYVVVAVAGRPTKQTNKTRVAKPKNKRTSIEKETENTILTDSQMKLTHIQKSHSLLTDN